MARVVVVGAGVVGLCCAVRLLEAGHRVDVVARDLPLETTSAVAAAVWGPYRIAPLDRVLTWSRAGYAELSALAGRPGTGVRLVEGTELHREPQPDPWWVSAVPALQRVADPPAPYADAWSFVAPVAEMPVYLRWLAGRVDELGGTLTRMALGVLPEHAEVVVNATGLGARRTAGDTTVEPVRGQVVRVEQVGLGRWWVDGAAPGGPVYVVPRSRDVVLGGTDEEGEWDRRPDPAVAERIRDRAVELVPELAGARVLAHRVGLRPARPTVRLELVEPTTRDAPRVVHCYGHGGAGVTTSWGCADEVVELVEAGQNSR